jgi:hypothetical protein
VVEDEPISGDNAITVEGFQSKFQQPALARTNRAIRKVTMPIFYGPNTFRCLIDPEDQSLEMISAFCSWSSAIGDNMRLIRRVSLVPCENHPKYTLELRSEPGKHPRYSWDENDPKHPCLVREESKGLEKLLNWVGQGCFKAEQYAEIINLGSMFKD